MTSKKSGAWGYFANAATMGIHMVTCTFVGLAIGYFLEKWLCDHGLCWKPWVMLFWLIAGIVAGFKNMFEDVRKMQQAAAAEEAEEDARKAEGKDDDPEH
ncbi:hypothetical protein dsx2_3286 [Desulfovibrio sp. X2]|uniref:AtpZ/AtpI family protein n=1 Tax=Desulfovibrio sp. X2 TaxID=941449 RepID=UPI000358AA16|nr:AtpZ/AtpI family protein [Desulfovibrio sp. X2]EPR40846.1 hypothetical protein dsx2_3286 [Desulfovibrio sp. X2]